MDFLGMGPLEFLLVLVLALVVLGPERLPEIAAQLGKLVRDIRRISAELSAEFNQGMQELQTVQQEVQQEVQDIRNISLDLQATDSPGSPGPTEASDRTDSPIGVVSAEGASGLVGVGEAVTEGTSEAQPPGDNVAADPIAVTDAPPMPEDELVGSLVQMPERAISAASVEQKASTIADDMAQLIAADEAVPTVSGTASTELTTPIPTSLSTVERATPSQNGRAHHVFSSDDLQPPY